MQATPQAPQQFVESADGVRIAVYEEGNPDGPTVVLVHGFPDSHVLWDGVVPLLADRCRVIRYDNRGVGMSSAPKSVAAYGMERFADDFAAVTGELSPGRPVHVLTGFAAAAKQGAQGAALIADGLAGGASAALVDALGIREASGTVLDHLYVITPAAARARLGIV